MPIRKLFLLTLMLLTTVGCGLLGGSQPPALAISDAAGETDLQLGSYCWSSVCVDAAYPPAIATYVELPASGAINLEFAGRLPDSGFISLASSDTFPEEESVATLKLETVAEPINWAPGVPAGDYILTVSARWAGGDASYHIGVTVP